MKEACLSDEMATEKAPVKTTGGGGFGFADKVGAFFLVNMLSGGFPLGPSRGTVSQLDFEARDRGWLLDDLLITLSNSGSTTHCALSIKSNEQVTAKGFPIDFTASIWEQARQTSPAVFQMDRDLLALGVSRIATAAETAWDLLLRQAIETGPERLVERLQADSGQSSDTQRKIFASLHCPTAVCPNGPNEGETAVIIRSIRLLAWDFEAEPSQAAARAVEICRSTLMREDADEATSLWERMQGLAADARTVGASYNCRTLLDKLRGKYALKEHPDFRPDWEVLQNIAVESRLAIKQEIGHGIRLSRAAAQKDLESNVSTAPITVVVGEPGSGKSALVVKQLEGDSLPAIWLDHMQFDQPNQTTLARVLNLRCTVPEIIVRSASPGGCLILDSLEKYSAQSRLRAAEIIKTITGLPERSWRVLITCQAHMWEHSLREFVVAGVRPEQIATLEITTPRPPEVIQAISAATPALVPLVLRPELQHLLCNLKVLDWIVTAETLRSSLKSHPFVGETDVIDWIWDRWTGASGDKYARAALLIKLGEHDGNTLAAAVNIMDLSDEERRTLRELELDDLVNVRHGRISFKHDLLGDWARLYALLAAGTNASEKIKEGSRFPRWQKAIRLYAQNLLEHKGGVRRWKEAISEFQGEVGNAGMAADYYLDALIFSGNAAALLEELWPDLLRDKAHILCRLLKRFLYIATIPDPRAEAFAEAGDLDWFSTRFRIPFVVYWYAPLRLLEQHRDDISEFALFLGAEICELWLRTIPKEWGGRVDAAKLAIHLAREVQGLRAEDVRFRDKADQKIYEALCHAAPDFPDEVAQILLELCHRRPESPEIVAREIACREKRRKEAVEQEKSLSPKDRRKRRSLSPPIVGSWDRGPKRPPAEDGPGGRVPESVQAAILDSSGLLSVAAVRPAVARELLLAVCIDEPKGEEYANLLGQKFGTAHWQGGHPAMFFRGPFLRFLEAEPTEAIEAIARLVNYATARWAEQVLQGAPADLDPDHYSLELQLHGATRRWTGNLHVLGWYREMMIGSHSVVSALMALEKWLYDGIDQGRDMSEWFELILSRSESVAFAGLLTAVGIRTPKLSAGPLRPLLGSWVLIHWQMHLSGQDDVWRIGMIPGRGRAGEKVIQWHMMPHRKTLLRDAAVQVLLSDLPTREFLDERRRAWLEQAREPNETVELLAATFDITNYSLGELGDDQASFRWPKHLRERTERQRQKARRSTLAVTFPHRCRRILNGKEKPPQPDTFWEELQQLADWKEPDLEQETITPESIAAAGIAVLIVCHRTWLAAHPEYEQWCLDKLRILQIETPGQFDTPDSILDTSTEAFVGEAAVALIGESDAQWIRELAARGVMSFYYASTRTVMSQAFCQRAVLKEEFGRIVNLMICWSGVRGAANHAQHTNQTATPAVERAANRLIRAFVTKRLSVSLFPLARIAEITRRFTEQIDARNPSPWGPRFHRRPRDNKQEREVDRDRYWLDTEVLSSGFGFLGPLDEASDGLDRQRLLDYYSALSTLFLSTMPKIENPDQEVEGAPCEFDSWVLRLTAAVVAQLPGQEARPFWQPVMDLGPGAHYWVEELCREWFLTGRKFAPSIDAFATQWRELILYSLQSQQWTGDMTRSYRLEGCALEVVGLSLVLEIVAAEEFTPIIQTLTSEFERWADRWLSHSRPASRFAYFLSQPAGRALLPSGIGWLSRAVESFSKYGWEEQYLSEGLVGALRVCWRNHRNNIIGNPELQNHFLQILNKLCNQLNADALALQAEISQVTQGPIA